MSKKQITYNINSSQKYGWTPEWFGASDFDMDLIEKIESFQKQNGLLDDGLCGSATYRRIFTEREKNISSSIHENTFDDSQKYIIYNGEKYPINWKKVVLWDEDNGLKAKKGNYREVIGKKREVKLFVNHWDVCLNSNSCQRVLDQRGISVTFLIDNDGTIYQTCDMNHITYHAGNANSLCTGVEISNAYYPKYQNWYVKNGFGERRITKGTVRGKQLEEHLDFYDIQIDALKQLWIAVSDACDIPLRSPIENGQEIDCLYQPALDGKWKGFVHHFHLSNKKIDCGGLIIKDHIGR